MADNSLSGGIVIEVNSVESDLVPQVDNTYSIGTTVKRWKDLFLMGILRLYNLTASSLLQLDASKNVIASNTVSQAVTFANQTTFSGANALLLTNTTPAIVLQKGGSGNTLTLQTTINPATSSRTISLTDPGANANVLLSESNQQVNAVMTYNNPGHNYKTGSGSSAAIIVSPSTGSGRRAEIDIDNWCLIQALSNTTTKDFGIYNASTGHSPLVFNTNDSLQMYAWYCSRPTTSISGNTTLDNTYSNCPILLSTSVGGLYTITLPTATNNPYNFEFVVQTILAANNILIQTNGGTEQSLFGTIFQNNISTKLSANKTITLNQANLTQGDFLRIKSNGYKFMVDGTFTNASAVTIT